MAQSQFTPPVRHVPRDPTPSSSQSEQLSQNSIDPSHEQTHHEDQDVLHDDHQDNQEVETTDQMEEELVGPVDVEDNLAVRDRDSYGRFSRSVNMVEDGKQEKTPDQKVKDQVSSKVTKMKNAICKIAQNIQNQM